MLLTRLRLAREVTLGLIKPTLTASPHLVKTILCRIDNCDDMDIVNARKLEFSHEMASKFYGEHHGKFFYPRLYNYIRSGPVVALALEGEDVISRWRTLIGPTKVSKTIYENPGTLRHDYGLSDTRNGFHGSDSIDNAFSELSIVFGDSVKNGDFNSVRQSRFKIDNIIYKTPNRTRIVEPTERIETETENESNAVFSNDDLAKFDFWETYHEKQTQEWFGSVKEILKYLNNEPDIKERMNYKSEECLNRLKIMDIGCGTSTLGVALALKLSYVELTLTDFSLKACKIQQNKFENLIEKYEKNEVGSGDLLADNSSSYEIVNENAVSIKQRTSSFDYIIDKGTMDAVTRLPEDECFQVMDEMVRILKINTGKIIQFTEEPPETRIDLWERWSQTTDKAVHISTTEWGDRLFIYKCTFSDK